MKYTAFLLGIAIFAAACSKDSGNPTTGLNTSPSDTVTPAPSLIASVRIYDSINHRLKIDSFEYDSRSRLTRYLFFNMDAVSPDYGSPGVLTFNYRGNDSLPVTCGTLHNNTHFLFYDADGRMVQDSLPDNYIYNFSYATDRIFVSRLLPPILQIAGDGLDTIQLQNNNMVQRDYWFYVSSVERVNLDFKFTYSAVHNPLYALRNLGMFLYIQRGKDLDFISEKLAVSVTDGTIKSIVDWKASGSKATSGTETYVINGTTYFLRIDFKYL